MLIRFQILLLAWAVLTQTVRGDPVEVWNNALLDSIRTENTHPCLAARAFAVVHGAMYDACAAITGRGRAFYASESVGGNLPLAFALNSAAFSTATNLFPSRTATFREVYSNQLKTLPDDPLRGAAIRLGRNIAEAWIIWRTSDGSSGTLPYIPSTQPGAWRRTPPFLRPPEMQNWARVIPFTLVSAAQFRPSGPPSLESGQYAEEVNLVKKLGGATSSDRTAEQTEIALFWSDFSYTVTPPGHWNQIAQAVAVRRQMTIEDKVRLFAVLNITLSDVGVSCWESKYFYNFWRPVTAIRAADNDSNPATEKDVNWMPLLNTPAFPEYISGHSAFSGAAAAVLVKFNGGDEIEFSVQSDSLPGKIRSYRSLLKCAAEVSQSRLYGGIHFPSALKDGLELGRQIAEHVMSNLFLSEDLKSSPKVFISPGELNRGLWLGLTTYPGQLVTLERQASTGEWKPWTNAVASSSTTRWALSPGGESSRFRATLQ